MADQTEYFAQAGIWDHLSSLSNFCEEDYAVTDYIAEFINTLSNIAYVYCALYYPAGIRRRRQRLDVMSFALIAVGVASALFHATLLSSMMFADDFSMWLIVAAILQPLYARGQSSLAASLVTAAIVLALGVVTAVYLYTLNVLIHTTFFFAMVNLIWTRTVYLIYSTGIRSQAEKSALIWRFWKAAATLVFAFVVWNIDLQMCVELRAIRHRIGLPWAWALELHGWWHVLTAVGAAEYITLVRALCP